MLRADTYRFSGDFRPHPENPIPNESYDELDEMIRGINERLGIGEHDSYFAYSLQTDNEPAVSVMRSEITDGSTLGITLEDEDGSKSVTARNDAGTVFCPHQSVAGVIEKDSSNITTRIEGSISATEFEVIANIVKKRAGSEGFEKKHSLSYLLAA